MPEIDTRAEERSNLGLGLSRPSPWQTSQQLADHSVRHGESTIVLNFLCPPSHGLANVTHLHESDKTIEVWRMSTKLEASYRAEARLGECRALTCKVDEFLMFLSTELTDLFGEITHYVMMII